MVYTYDYNYTEQYDRPDFMSMVNTRLTPKNKLWFKEKINNHNFRTQMITDLSNGLYNVYHRLFTDKAHPPTDFLTICLLTMNDKQIDSIDENLINFNIKEFIEEVGTEYCPPDRLIHCACNKYITDVTICENKETGIKLLMGCCCALKTGIISKEKFKNNKKNIKLKKELYKIKKEYNMCIECKEYTIPKIKINDTICEKCVYNKYIEEQNNLNYVLRLYIKFGKFKDKHNFEYLFKFESDYIEWLINNDKLHNEKIINAYYTFKHNIQRKLI